MSSPRLQRDSAANLLERPSSFPKLGIPFLGGPLKEGFELLGSVLGSPYLRNYRLRGLGFEFCLAVFKGFPSGSKDLNNKVLGPKYYNINGIWGLQPYYLVLGPLGFWTLLLLSSRSTWSFRLGVHYPGFLGFGVLMVRGFVFFEKVLGTWSRT